MQYLFGEYVLDTGRCELCRTGTLIKLRPKVFDVLCYLLAHRDRVISRQELLEVLWPQQFIGEATLNSCIMEARQAVGDTGQAQRLIQTLHGRGYRFIAPVQALAAPGGSAERDVLRTAPFPRFRRPAHFVGREAELAQVMQWWSTAQQGRRQVGIIAGEPGIGKTALVEAFVAHGAAGGDCWVAHGQCSEPYGPGEPYQPVLEALGRLGRDREGARLVAVLRQYAPSWLVQMPALLPPAEWEALQRTMGHTGEPRMLRELTDVLDALTTERPLVLVLEDLHWSDRATLAWLAAVARRPDPARLLILGTYRPVDAMVHACPLRALLTELRQHGQCVELALDYLSDDAVTAYLGQRFRDPAWAGALAGVLHQRTSGNPLFLLVVVDELIRQQVVTEGPAGWGLQGSVETILTIVPAHLQALIEHQLAACSPEDQALLAVASVAGLAFAAATVAAGLTQTDEVVEARCAALAQQGRFLQAHGSAAWPDGTVTACYRFRHALYQAVVYQRLPAGHQTQWHARMGTRLVHGFGAEGGDMAVTIAQHCLYGRLWPQAVRYLGQAGQQATQREAYQEAVAFYEQALGILPHLPEHPDTRVQAIDLRIALRHVLYPSGDVGRILTHLREAEALAEALGDAGRLRHIASLLSLHLCDMGTYDQAIVAAQRALALATASGGRVLWGRTHHILGRAYMAQGDYRRAIACFRQTAASIAQAQSHEYFGHFLLPAVTARTNLARCHAELGTFAEGMALGDEGLRIAEAVAHPASLMLALWGSGLLLLRQGDLPRALPRLEQAVGICGDVSLLRFFPQIAAALGAAYTWAGRVIDAVPLLTQALEQLTVTVREDFQALCVLALGEAHLQVGHLEDAHTLAQRALKFARDHQERGHEAYALRLLGDIAVRRALAPTSAVATPYHQALALANELGMRPLMAHCHQSLGTLYAQLGQRKQAQTALATAIAMYRAMEMTFWLPETEAALAQVEREH